MSRRSYTPVPFSPDGDASSNPISDPRPPSMVSNNSFTSSARKFTNYPLTPAINTTKFKFQVPTIVKRLFKPPTLDFEKASWEIFHLIINPRKVYRSLYYHKQTKNTWARDDPSFIILLSLFLTVSAVAWGLAYSPGVWSIFKLIIYMVVVDFFCLGCVISTLNWFLTNKLLMKKSDSGIIGGVGNDVLEWGFCFDVHCNSFLMIWVLLYLLQFILLPFLTVNNWFGLFLGNTLYFVSLSYYFLITFYGYNALPFLEHTELILLPIPLLAVGYVISLFGFNIAKTMAESYFN